MDHQLPALRVSTLITLPVLIVFLSFQRVRLERRCERREGLNRVTIGPAQASAVPTRFTATLKG